MVYYLRYFKFVWDNTCWQWQVENTCKWFNNFTAHFFNYKVPNIVMTSTFVGVKLINYLYDVLFNNWLHIHTTRFHFVAVIVIIFACVLDVRCKFRSYVYKEIIKLVGNTLGIGRCINHFHPWIYTVTIVVYPYQ